MQGLERAGHEVEVLDLHRSGFDPVLREADEPDWAARRPRYSPEAEREIARMQRHEGLAFVFPLWWWSVPALLKGYLDRVWNYGVAYGPSRLQHRRVLWLALAGAPPERFEKRHYDRMIEHHFNVGLADYVGIPCSEVALLYETIRARPGSVEGWLEQAYDLGRRYAA